MSQYPRRVMASITVTADGGRTSVFVKNGTVVDIKPGSQLEAAYAAGNLSAVIPAGDPSRSPEAATQLSKEALAN
jgi:hypothetical protein